MVSHRQISRHASRSWELSFMLTFHWLLRRSMCGRRECRSTLSRTSLYSDLNGSLTLLERTNWESNVSGKVGQNRVGGPLECGVDSFVNVHWARSFELVKVTTTGHKCIGVTAARHTKRKEGREKKRLTHSGLTAQR